MLDVTAVNYEARLEDGTVVGKADGVEFTVKDGQYLSIDCQIIFEYLCLFVLQIISDSYPCIQVISVPRQRRL